MGTWDSGPFDNDTAADWCGDLDDADVAQRPALVREALTRSAGEDGYLDGDPRAPPATSRLILRTS